MELIIFDMDGTLLDTRIDITISVNHVRRIRHGLPPLSEAEVVEYINRRERNLPLLFYGTEIPDPEDRALFREHYLSQCTQNLRLFPGIRELLEELKRREVRMAVATNASTLFARRMIRHAGIDRYFHAVAGADTTGRSKPDPAMLHHLMGTMGFDPDTGDRGWMLGDSDKDLEAARGAGLGTLYAAWGYSRQPLPADAILSHPTELLPILRETRTEKMKGDAGWN